MTKYLDKEITISFYENVKDVWPKDDMWHTYSKKQIEMYLHNLKIIENATILNAGSGGNDYGLEYDMYHVDITSTKIGKFPKAIVANIEDLPFNDKTFDFIICVGSVLNYCDAMAALSELSRVIKKGGILVLEFESSWSFEYWKKSAYKKSAEIVTVNYHNQPHMQWVYSLKYIKALLNQYNFSIKKVFRFHILSGLHYNKYQNEKNAAKLTKYDKVLRYIPIIKDRSSNIILLCQNL